jgi:hypothetical protein
MAASMMRQVADALRATGGFDALDPAMTQADAQRLFGAASTRPQPSAR